MKVTKAKTQPKVTLKLTPGKLTPAQREAGKRLWAKLLDNAGADEGVRHD